MWNWGKIYWFMTPAFKNLCEMIPFGFLTKLWKDSTRKNSVKIRVKESREFDEKEIQSGTKDPHSLVNHP